MRANTLIGTLVLAISALAGCKGDMDPAKLKPVAAAVPTDFAVHKSADGKVSVKTPAAWEERALTGNVVVNVADMTTGRNVNVVVTDGGLISNLPFNMKATQDLLAKKFTDYNHLGTDYIRIGDHAAGRITSELTTNGTRLKMTQVFVIANKHNYALTIGAPAKAFDAQFADQVVASFQVP